MLFLKCFKSVHYRCSTEARFVALACVKDTLKGTFGRTSLEFSFRDKRGAQF